nr:MAG TPA: DNA encapsidation protein [Caudoviricetes sp.]
MSIFNSQSKYQKELAKIKKGIPKKYNQLEFMNYLDDKDVDLLVSITTRNDGKTYNVLRALALLHDSLKFCTLIVTRHSELKSAMITQIRDIYFNDKELDNKSVNVMFDLNLCQIYYHDELTFLIVDLNNADDLKYYRAMLKKCNIVLYDEFLSIGGDYAANEYKKFKTIFETMDSDETDAMQYTNHLRKAIFLANPVDWNSEFLARYNLYKALETQPINTVQKHGNIVLERRRNNQAQATKNNRLFDEDESITGEFKYNSWQLKEPKSTTLPIIIKTVDRYIYIYVEDKPILSVKPIAESYSFNTDLADNKKESVYLKKNYYKDNFYKKYTKDYFYFENAFSKEYILQNYSTLDFIKILKQSNQDKNSTENIDKRIKQDEFKTMINNIARSYLQ